MRADMVNSYRRDKYHPAGSEVAREAPSETDHEEEGDRCIENDVKRSWYTYNLSGTLVK